ncbi:aldo/keto reductase [Campylobacter jejuni]|uniref:Aldo/keto reductase n=1 Tax=Campylobacter jejuni TaxID=197 RepID=A0A6F9MTM5_CAMJU|nr:aldo/keto reductase [Campylobacter coli]NHH48696.1 aldo/keto reductase [Campylobacter coli]
MQKRNLRNLRPSTLGLGCMGMSFGYGKAKDEKEMINLIHKAKDFGISFFDTAEAYGPYINEELVGKAIKIFRNEAIIATKFGITIEGSKQILDSSPKTIRKSIEGSLKRLNIDYIDLYYQHRVDTKVSVEEVASLMSELYKEGKIKAWGMSEAGIQSIKKAHAVFPLTAVQSEYSLWWREPENELLGVLEDLNIGFVPFSPLGKGFLAGRFDANSIFANDDFRSQVPRFESENLKANLVLLDALKDLANSKNATLAQIALAWILAQKDYIVPIFGTTNLQRLEENINALNISFTQEELKTVKNILDKIKIKGDRYKGEAAARVGK